VPGIFTVAATVNKAMAIFHLGKRSQNGSEKQGRSGRVRKTREPVDVSRESRRRDAGPVNSKTSEKALA